MNFYADDHLCTMMLIDNSSRALDFQYILWTFDTSKIDHASMKRLDHYPGFKQEQNIDDDDEAVDLPAQENMLNEGKRAGIKNNA